MVIIHTKILLFLFNFLQLTESALSGIIVVSDFTPQKVITAIQSNI